jgi:hypothetical protein
MVLLGVTFTPLLVAVLKGVNELCVLLFHGLDN